MPEVSIIIPVYNAAAYLPKCIESVTGQTYSDIEILLVNDGSTDDSLAVCNEYAARDSRIRVLDKPNGGVSDARNHGIDNAGGRYLMFVDSDDWIATDAILTCHPYMQCKDYDIIRFNAYAVFSHKLRKYRLGHSDDIRKITASIVSRKTIVACWGALFRKELFTGLRFDTSLNIGEDWLMTAQLTLQSDTIKMLPESYLYYYNKTNEESCTLTMGTGKIMTQFKALGLIRQFIPDGYSSEFSFTKCLFIQELIDNCGMTEAGRLLHDAGISLDSYDIMHIMPKNISIRKKFSLLKFMCGGYIGKS